MISKQILFILVGVYIFLVGLAYFLIFRKHHKRNKVEIDELISLVARFFSVTTISFIMIGCGIYLFRNAAIHKYDIEEVRSSLVLGMFIISATVLNYINYIKRSLKDYDEEIRQEKRKKDIKIGEILLLIVLLVLMFVPAIKIPTFIKLKEFQKELYIEIAKSVLISISSIFLLYNLNPIGIKDKIFKKKDKEKEENN